jgi:4-amino-4-deoxy-L-arabinose transferase-like glycosyltransferase
VRRGELARLLPLLAVYVAAMLLFPEHPDDEASYLTLAERLAHGTYVAGDDDALLDADPSSPDLWFGPGLPAVLAPLVAVDAPVEVVRLVGPVALFGAILCFYVLVRERWGRRTALVASYGLGLYPPFWALLPNVHSEPLAILFLAAALLALSQLLRAPGRARLVGAGAALAALALTRPAYGWVLTIVLVVLLVRLAARRTAAVGWPALALALALALCVPWLAYTAARTGRPLVWASSGSLSLYWMSSPYEGDSGDWRQADDVFTDERLAPHRAFFDGLHGLTLAEQNAEIEQEALRNIRDHPDAYAGNVAANVSRLLVNAPYSDSRWRPNDLFYAVPGVFVAGAVVLCLIVLPPRRRRLPPETLVFALVGGAATAVHVLVSAYPRMLTVLVPIVAWFTTLALVELGVLSARPAAAPLEHVRRSGRPAPHEVRGGVRRTRIAELVQ